jgi:uncharacterized protein
MQTIGITGGTGFIGRHLTALLLLKGYAVVIFSRSSHEVIDKHVTYAHWHPDKGACDIRALKSLDAVINLAGAGIADKRLTEARKKQVIESRVKGTQFLLACIKEHAPNCKTLVSASAIGYYGPDRKGASPFTETAPPYNDFMATVCREWERAALQAEEFMRTVIIRTGIVLGKDGGSFPKLAGPMSFGIMPILGSGRQIVSWIAIDDLAALYLFALENTHMGGIYNGVAPRPVEHKLMMRTIAKAKGGIKIPVPAPAFLLKIVLGELSEEVLKSCTVSAEKISTAGFSFKHPDINSAVKILLPK